MKVFVKKEFGQLNKFNLVVVPVNSKDLAALNKKSGAHPLKQMDKALQAELKNRIKRAEFKAKADEELLIDLDMSSPQLLFLGWEDGKDEFQQSLKFLKLGNTIYRNAKRLKSKKVALVLFSLVKEGEQALTKILEGLELSNYSFTRYKSKSEKRAEISELHILGVGKISAHALETARTLAQGTFLARNLINTPARDCTPSLLMRTAREIGRKQRLGVTIYPKARLKKMGAGCILGLSQGSSEPPFLIRMQYKPKGRAKKVISLVGKGVTFDSGGLSIKTGIGMESMKIDMSGAAAVLGVMSIISKIKPDVEVRAYIPTCENMISGEATRPGDIIRAMNGKTIEVLNTDAEGRLILADALTLASREKSDIIIDLATLTGACVVALGPEYAGLFSTDKGLTRDLQKAAEESAERYWELPLSPEYRQQIDSPIADLKNIGNRDGGGGAIIGALFLKEFVSAPKWAHLDIAGPASCSADKNHLKRGGVGFGVRTLARYLMALK